MNQSLRSDLRNDNQNNIYNSTSNLFVRGTDCKFRLGCNAADCIFNVNWMYVMLNVILGLIHKLK